MINGLRNGEIDFCIIGDDRLSYYNETRLDLKLEKVKKLGYFPLCFTFQKDKEILLSIINKANGTLFDYTDIKSKFLKEKNLLKTVKALEKRRKKEERKTLIISFIGLLSILVIINRILWSKKLHKLAYYDQLTLALNRTSFKKEVEKINFNKKKGIGLFIDLNDFKGINDKYGHIEGDTVLKEVVHRLHKIFNKNEVFRMSGDEFFILQKEGTLLEAVKLAKIAVKELRNPFKSLDLKNGLGVSIGICEVKSGVKNSEEFIHWADIAMYSAKKNGNNSIVIATNDLIDKFNNQKKLNRDLKKALENREIIPYFQPKIDLKSGRINGFEALARWRHKEKGFISPGIFIPIAEEKGLVPDLDFIIAEATIKSIKVYKDKGLISEKFKGSFNLSVKTIEKIKVTEKLRFLLKKYGVSGKNIEVEVTESIFINKEEKVIKELSALKKELGISIALDDFTAGHSSLRELARLPIDTLKFDRSLLLAIDSNEKKGKLIYSSLIKLSNNLGYYSVAEGIENSSQKEFLIKEGVFQGQGYFFGKPLPKQLFLKVLFEDKIESVSR